MAATVILGSSGGASLKPPLLLGRRPLFTLHGPSRGCSRAHSTQVQNEGGQKPAVNKRHLAHEGAVPDAPGKGECLGTEL